MIFMIIPTPSESLRDLGVKEILNEIILFLICLPKQKEIHKQNHWPVKEQVRHSTSFLGDFHGLSTSNMLKLQGGGSVVISWKLQGVSRHQLFSHASCATLQAHVTWATDCSNASFSRFRLLTLANQGTFDATPPQPPAQKIGQKLRNY